MRRELGAPFIASEVSEPPSVAGGLTRREFDGENLEEVKHFPAEQEDGDDYRAHRENLSETHAVIAGLKALYDQAKNVERREAENERPEDVVEVRFFVRGLEDGEGGKNGERRDLDRCSNRLHAGELVDQV